MHSIFRFIFIFYLFFLKSKFVACINNQSQFINFNLYSIVHRPYTQHSIINLFKTGNNDFSFYLFIIISDYTNDRMSENNNNNSNNNNNINNDNRQLQFSISEDGQQTISESDLDNLINQSINEWQQLQQQRSTEFELNPTTTPIITQLSS